MIGAIFRCMFLELIRDRGALLLAFALPGVFFLIFAEIFATTARGDMVVTTAWSDTADSPLSRRLVDILADDPRLRLLPAAGDQEIEVTALVREGAADAGLMLRPDPGGRGLEALLLIDPARGAAGALLRGRLGAALASALPPAAAASPGITISARSVFDPARGVHEVSYAAGAVSFMFLLFASTAGAMSLMEERESGILDRVLAGPGGVDVLVTGKFLYLLAQGVVQVGLIFVVAWLAFGVALPDHLGAWLVVTVCAATTAAGLAMLLVAASATRKQAQTVSTLAILVLSAVGGSMVPRYVMPPLFQSLGWATPNTWAVEAYAGIFWREESLVEVALPCLVLAAGGLAALALAVLLARLRARG